MRARLELNADDSSLKTEHDRLQAVLSNLGDELREVGREIDESLKAEFGLDDDWLQEFEKSSKISLNEDYWHSDIQRVPVNARLEDVVKYGYERLIEVVDEDWIRQQSAFRYRQRYDNSEFSDCRLHLVGRHRLLAQNSPPQPHRLAHMLLVCQDMLQNRDDIDLFDGPMLVTEGARLGGCLNLLEHLGPEGKLKFDLLKQQSSRDVASTVYELAVGVACIEAGREIEMLPASKSEKTPDFRIHDLAVPLVVECKRRLGLSEYAEKEARHIELLYSAAEKLFVRHHPIVEVVFNEEVFNVTQEIFVSSLTQVCESDDDEVEGDFSWGKIRRISLPSHIQIQRTRVFSPVFLQSVFDWNHVQNDWDGLLCRIDPTFSPTTDRVEWPHALKWRCESERSMLKKARGVTSLWADGVKQIPSGEMGCIYIAYSESMREAIADARTQHLFDSVSNKTLHHRDSILVPLTVIDRLYPQALGNGGLEMIESVIPVVQDGFEFMVNDFPLKTFNVRKAS